MAGTTSKTSVSTFVDALRSIGALFSEAVEAVNAKIANLEREYPEGPSTAPPELIAEAEADVAQVEADAKAAAVNIVLAFKDAGFTMSDWRSFAGIIKDYSGFPTLEAVWPEEAAQWAAEQEAQHRERLLHFARSGHPMAAVQLAQHGLKYDADSDELVDMTPEEIAAFDARGALMAAMFGGDLGALAAEDEDGNALASPDEPMRF